ncbi:MAG: transposase [Planctomycetaceae bacterium]
MSLQGVWSECLEFHPQKRLVVENSGGRLSSDAGLLLVRELDERLGLMEQFAAVIEEWRREPTHSLLSMVRRAASMGVCMGIVGDSRRGRNVDRMDRGRRRFGGYSPIEDDRRES